MVERFANLSGVPAKLTFAWPNSQTSSWPSTVMPGGFCVPISPHRFQGYDAGSLYKDGAERRLGRVIGSVVLVEMAGDIIGNLAGTGDVKFPAAYDILNRTAPSVALRRASFQPHPHQEDALVPSRGHELQFFGVRNVGTPECMTRWFPRDLGLRSSPLGRYILHRRTVRVSSTI